MQVGQYSGHVHLLWYTPVGPWVVLELMSRSTRLHQRCYYQFLFYLSSSFWAPAGARQTGRSLQRQNLDWFELTVCGLSCLLLTQLLPT